MTECCPQERTLSCYNLPRSHWCQGSEGLASLTRSLCGCTDEQVLFVGFFKVYECLGLCVCLLSVLPPAGGVCWWMWGWSAAAWVCAEESACSAPESRGHEGGPRAKHPTWRQRKGAFKRERQKELTHSFPLWSIQKCSNLVPFFDRLGLNCQWKRSGWFQMDSVQAKNICLYS